MYSLGKAKLPMHCVTGLGDGFFVYVPPPLPPPPPLPAQAYDLSATTDIIQNINSKCIEYVITIIKLPKIHLNIKYFMQFSFLVISQCHSCVIFFQSNRPMEKLQPCHYSISCRAAPKT